MEREDYFSLFGLPRAHGIDLALLEAAYEKLSFECHPDFLANAPAEEKLRAQHLSARINQGYRVLNSEPARAAYLLGLLASGRELDTQALPRNFLQQMFELQEEADEADGAEETPASAALRAKLSAQLAERMEDIHATRARLFTELGAAPTLEALNAIQANLNSERYLQRLRDRLGKPE